MKRNIAPLRGAWRLVRLALETQAHRPFLGGAVGTNWWCTGFILICLVALPSVRQLLESGQVPRWVPLVAAHGP